MIAAPAYRLPEATHVGGVRLLVSDLERSADYYQQLIGLHQLAATHDSATLGPHGDDRALVTLHTRPEVSRARRGAFGLYHFAILLPERAALGRFVAHASTLGVRIASADHLVSEALYLWDPDGLGIEVYADRPRETWSHRNGELAMATDPLDIGDLMAAAGGTSWSGAPPGTTMGHVHLQVGDLADAEAFYHRALGFDKTVWSYPGALFYSAGGYHHHLATNTWASGPSARAHEARLLEWELVLPDAGDVALLTSSVQRAGYETHDDRGSTTLVDPWGTRVRVRSGER